MLSNEHFDGSIEKEQPTKFMLKSSAKKTHCTKTMKNVTISESQGHGECFYL